MQHSQHPKKKQLITVPKLSVQSFRIREKTKARFSKRRYSKTHYRYFPTVRQLNRIDIKARRLRDRLEHIRGDKKRPLNKRKCCQRYKMSCYEGREIADLWYGQFEAICNGYLGLTRYQASMFFRTLACSDWCEDTFDAATFVETPPKSANEYCVRFLEEVLSNDYWSIDRLAKCHNMFRKWYSTFCEENELDCWEEWRSVEDRNFAVV